MESSNQLNNAVGAGQYAIVTGPGFLTREEEYSVPLKRREDGRAEIIQAKPRSDLLILFLFACA